MGRDLTVGERVKAGVYAAVDVVVSAGLGYVAIETSTVALWSVVVAFVLLGVPLARASITGRGGRYVRYVLHETDEWGG